MSCNLNIKKLFIGFIFCFVVAGVFYYTLIQNVFVNFTVRPSAAVNEVVALTGFLSISQHQLNSKTKYSENLHIVRVHNLTNRESVFKAKTKDEDELEELERYTLPKPSLEKLRRKFKDKDDLDEKFFRTDEKSIQRIVNNFGTDFDDDLPEVFKKKGEPKKRLPNAIIIGVKKGGTRALLEMLKLHPRVCTSGPEIHYFDRHHSKGIEWYRSKMPLCYENEVTVEKTPSYFVTNGVAKDVFEYSKLLNRTLKLIVIVRDPTRRAISDFTQTQASSAKKVLNRNFEEYATVKNIEGKLYVNSQWGGIKIGLYSKHLKRWLQYFKASQIHLVSGETLIKKPYEELKRVEDFLNLPAFIKPDHFVYNKTKGFYCFDKQTSQPRKNANETNLRCLGSTKGRVHFPVSPETENLLRDYYRPFNEELYKLYGRNFGWT